MGLYVMFNVHDRYIRCEHTEPQSMVCNDSCVESFFQPRVGAGYFNFEINCGGTLLLWHVTKPCLGGSENGRGITRLPMDLCSLVQIYHTLPRVIVPEITEWTWWRIGYYVPFALFETVLGSLGCLRGQQWRGNFYKCGDGTSHPHWASWSPIGHALEFHQPQCFAPLVFG
jgi:hypothetical protein